MDYDFPELKKQSTDQNGWVKGCCPIHADKNPSFSYNPDTGAWTCFSQCGSGNYRQFLELYDPSALDNLDKKKTKPKRRATKKKEKKLPPIKLPPIKESYIKKCQEYLNDSARRYLLQKRGINNETIEKYQIGWDVEEQRNTIPIRNEKGKLLNVRRYTGKGKKQFRMMPYNQTVNGKPYSYGSPISLYGLDELVKHKGDEVIICEGEWDRLLLQQNGFMAVTATGGCKSFMSGWVHYFKGKDVVLLYDCDGPGQLAALGRMLPMFENAGVKSIKNVVLPLSGTETDNDVTDYFHKNGYGAETLRGFIDSTKIHLYDSQVEGEKESTIILDSFVDMEKEDYIDKRVQCEIVISGETSESFHAVSQFKVKYCKLQKSSKCMKCMGPIDIPKNADEYIGSCMSTKAQITGMLRNYCCEFEKAPTIEITHKVPIKEFFCHQVVKRVNTGANRQELLEKKCYYLSSDHVLPGAYTATGYIKTHPKTQAITFLIETLIAQDDDYQSFNLEKERGLLEQYRDLTFTEIIKDLTNNVTNIYKRDELLIAVLLTFFSPLWFKFNSRQMRGWILSIIIGDSGLGKTQTYSRISDYISAGDFFSCLTGSRTGLAYALTDHPTRGWQVKIGRYPANSGKLLAVDEIQHLDMPDLQSISKAMDEGFLQIDKVKSKGYETMTRLLMLCNPKYDRVMDECMYGCETLKTIFPPTLLRRVDFAIFANAGDMTDYSVMNKKNSTDGKISAEMLQAAVFWAWNLKTDQIYFEPDAEKYCLDNAEEISREFGNAVDIPLVAPSDFRFNLARISVAFASMLMSTDDFKTLIVKEEHVRKAINFIRLIYRHQSCALDKYSENVKIKTHLLDYDRVEKVFLKKAAYAATHSSSGGEHSFVKIIYQFKINTVLRRDDLKDFVGCGLDAVKKTISLLKTFHLIKSDKNGYRKQPKFVKFLREFERKNKTFFDILDAQEDDEYAGFEPEGELV